MLTAEGSVGQKNRAKDREAEDGRGDRHLRPVRHPRRHGRRGSCHRRGRDLGRRGSRRGCRGRGRRGRIRRRLRELHLSARAAKRNERISAEHFYPPKSEAKTAKPVLAVPRRALTRLSVTCQDCLTKAMPTAIIDWTTQDCDDHLILNGALTFPLPYFVHCVVPSL